MAMPVLLAIGMLVLLGYKTIARNQVWGVYFFICCRHPPTAVSSGRRRNVSARATCMLRELLRILFSRQKKLGWLAAKPSCGGPRAGGLRMPEVAPLIGTPHTGSQIEFLRSLAPHKRRVAVDTVLHCGTVHRGRASFVLVETRNVWLHGTGIGSYGAENQPWK